MAMRLKRDFKSVLILGLTKREKKIRRKASKENEGDQKPLGMKD